MWKVCVCGGGRGSLVGQPGLCAEKNLKTLIPALSNGILILSVVIKRAASTCLSALFLSLSLAHLSSSSPSSAPFI